MEEFQSVFLHLPRLETERLILRRVRLRDAQDMFVYSKDDEVSRHVLWDTHKTLSDSVACCRAIKRQYRYGLPSTFAIELKETGHMIGTIGFMWINTEHRSAEVGYSLSRAYWNRGLTTEALRKVLEFAFEDLDLHRVEAQYEVDNPASGRVMEKCGMTCEGLMHDRVFNKGHYSDVYVYAILKNQFEGERNHV